MPRLPGVNHLDAVRALEKSGFRVARGGGPVMVWIGLIAGLAVCSILLLIRYAFITRSRVAAASHSFAR